MGDTKSIVNVTRGNVVCENVVVADRPLRRMRGLLGRASLPAGEGLLLRPAPSIHTAFMRFPIDAIFLDRDSIVLRVIPALAPWRAASERRARAVLEVAAGESERRGVHVGDLLLRLAADATGERRGPAVSGIEREVGKQARAGSTSNDESGGGDGKPDVLLVSRDRRFRGVTAALLSARGFKVTAMSSYPGANEMARRQDAVVVIDADDSLSEATRAAARAGLMTGQRDVVFVTGRAAPAATPAHVVPKWASVEELSDAIHSAWRSPRHRDGGDPIGRSVQ
jgi:uncharacterized membrane protein (UPF0127 family)